MLGPVRFEHIENCATEVCLKFEKKEETEDFITRLTELDETIARLRTDLARAKGEEQGPLAKDSNYNGIREALDVEKARRLLGAREKTVTSLKKLIESTESVANNETSTAN